MRLIGIAGATASGKTTIARGLIEHFNADTNRFSNILAAIAIDVGLSTEKESLQTLSTSLRRHLGEDVLARGMCAWVERSNAETIVLEGLRRMADIELLARVAAETGRDWTFLYIDVPFDIRFERFKEREGDIREEEFAALDTQECEQELPLLKARAHFVLSNGEGGPQEMVAAAIAQVQGR